MEQHNAERRKKFGELVKACELDKDGGEINMKKLNNFFDTMYEKNLDLEEKYKDKKKKLEKANKTIFDLETQQETDYKETTAFRLPSSLAVLNGTTNVGETLIVGPENCVKMQYHFVLNKKLGKGSYGTVYKVTCNNNKNAIKVSFNFHSCVWKNVEVIEKDKLSEKFENKKLLQNEIDIHWKLDHANICRLECAFQDEDRLYLLLELCEENSLRNLIQNQRAIYTRKPEVSFSDKVFLITYIPVRPRYASNDLYSATV